MLLFIREFKSSAIFRMKVMYLQDSISSNIVYKMFFKLETQPTAILFSTQKTALQLYGELTNEILRKLSAGFTKFPLPILRATRISEKNSAIAISTN